MADEIVEKRGRGRPKGTGGNKRPDRSDALSVHMEPGENVGLGDTRHEGACTSQRTHWSVP